MRNYLIDINITGAVLMYREAGIARYCLDWLYENCDRVLIVLDNYNKETEQLVFEYRDRYPDITRIGYTTEPVGERRNHITGQQKRRFKLRQHYIRESVILELKKMHQEKPIDLLIWPDSDEIFIDEFPKYLEEFWNSDYRSMALGFLEVYDSFKLLITQPMAPHMRIFKFTEEMTALPYQQRCAHYPYNLTRPWKIRHLVVHLCHLNEVQREFRQFVCNQDMIKEKPREAWILPKDVRKMTVEEINDYQYGYRHSPPKYQSFPLIDYINNKSKYLNL